MKTLDELLLEADQIGLRLTVENGGVKVRFAGSDDDAAEALLREIHVHGRDELAARLDERGDVPAAVPVTDRRAAARLFARPSSSAPVAPAWRKVDARAWELADAEVLEAFFAAAARCGLGVAVDGLTVRASTTDDGHRAEAILQRLPPPRAESTPAFSREEPAPPGPRNIVAGPLGDLVKQPWEEELEVRIASSRPLSQGEIAIASGAVPPPVRWNHAWEPSRYDGALADLDGRFRQYVGAARALGLLR